MTLDEYIKQIIRWNTSAFKYINQYLNTLPLSKETKYMGELARAGFQKNFYLNHGLEQIKFVPGNIPSLEIGDGLVDDFGEAPPPKAGLLPLKEPGPVNTPEEIKRRKDVEELEKLFALEYDKKESENNGLKHELKDEKEKTNGTIEQIGGREIGPNGNILPNWYKRIFKPGDKREE